MSILSKLGMALVVASSIFFILFPYKIIEKNEYHYKEKSIVIYHLPVSKDKDLKQKIIEGSLRHNISPKKSLSIADCESNTGFFKFNLSGSSAKGIFQFIDSTWEKYCEGDVLDEDDNIECFFNLYPKHPTWWECSG